MFPSATNLDRDSAAELPIVHMSERVGTKPGPSPMTWWGCRLIRSRSWIAATWIAGNSITLTGPTAICRHAYQSGSLTTRTLRWTSCYRETG